ncbi:zinc finger MYND domain-containing protein 12 isoform X2 [Pipistrellus kuhlii]|uniref:zinc finger MYND domain-containing protein 12 isoform X2 n=1 Tax=Pipistrellus kuhlii TaxID=59472 RepID=UPI00174F3201|nr:zinc finger MYND domain-containing protein 12 isoform X2 [Pipistrellus kuhlii]
MLGTRWPRGGHVTPASSVSSPGNGPADGRRRLQHEQDLPTGGAQGAPDLLRSVRSSSRAGVPGLHSHLLLKHLIEFCYTVAQKYIFEERYKEAVPAALHSLRFRMNVYGLSSVELVPAYLLLAEASIGLDQIIQAEEYLSQAQWTVLKSTDCSYATHSLLHRNLGLLFIAKENYDEARYHLANDIYFASCAFGTEGTRTSGGYFLLANIFLDLSKLDLADTLYTKVCDIWDKYLNNHYQVLSEARVQQIDLLGKRFETDTGLDEAQEAEAIRILTSILTIRESTPIKAPLKIVFVLRVLAMLYYLMMNSSKAHEYATRAFNVVQESQLGAQEQNLIELLLNIISTEETYPIL